MLPQLSTSGGKLFSCATRGKEVYAATFVRQRRIVLDLALLQQPALFRAILIHELFHFVWVRLGNPVRNSFGDLLLKELDGKARGELGESSSIAKLSAWNSPKGGRHWSHYTCESFCDTAAYLLSGSNAGEERSRLAQRWLKARTTWFVKAASAGWAC